MAVTGPLSDQKFLEKLTRITEEHLSEEGFGVPQLVRAMGVSRSGLYRRIKQMTGKPASTLVREQRLRKAMELLGDQNLTVSEVAWNVGFGSVAYFDRCFHQYFGESPGDARRKILENEELVRSRSPSGEEAATPLLEGVTTTPGEEATTPPGEEATTPLREKTTTPIRQTDTIPLRKEATPLLREKDSSPQQEEATRPPREEDGRVAVNARKFPWLVAAVSGVVLLMVFLLFMGKERWTAFLAELLPEGKNKSIAVLPFVSESTDIENLYFNNGITSAITDRYWKSPLFVLTSIYAARGNRDQAMENLRLLRMNFKATDLQVVLLLKQWPMFEGIRGEPEFRDYLKAAEAHYLEEHRKVRELISKGAPLLWFLPEEQLKPTLETNGFRSDHGYKGQVFPLFEGLEIAQRFKMIDQVGGEDSDSCTRHHIGEPVGIVGDAQEAGRRSKNIATPGQ